MIIGKIKRKTKLFDSEKGIDIWVWFDKMDGEVVAYDNPEFKPPYYLAKKSDLKQSKQNKASSISNKPKKLTEVQKSDKQKLTDFFDSLKVPDKCQECGQKLITYNKFARRSVCCHILPKFKFESIAMNPLNILFMGADFLGGCCDHDIFDNSVSNRIKMNVYPLVLERFDMLKPLLTLAETLKAMEYLGIPITQEILKELK